MLLNFSAKNYKSFRDGFDLSMKASLVRDLNFSVTCDECDARILTSSVIYGPNAAGKSTLIESILFLKSVILQGSIAGNYDKDVFKRAFPFAYSEEEKPMSFQIEFINNNEKFQFGISFLYGSFSDDINKKIFSESLAINNKLIYSRTINNVQVNYENIDSNKLIKGLEKEQFKDYISIFNNSLSDTDLFLNKQFPTMISKYYYDQIIEWFSKKLIVIPNFNYLHFLMEQKNSTEAILPGFAYDAVKEIGAFGSELKYVKDSKGHNRLYSRFDTPTASHVIESSLVESYGTLRFLDIYPLLLQTIANGGVLIVDELDASLHPMVIMSIVNIFHDPEINIHHAQLIFNTHNPVFLNNKVFRRDEMCFVEKNKENNVSEFYKLSDFLTNSNTPTRNTTDYLNNYFLNRYGAIEFVDLSDAVKRFMNLNKIDISKEEDRKTYDEKTSE